MENSLIEKRKIPAIYRLMKRLYVREMGEVMAQYDLTRMELDVLIFLDQNPGVDTAAEIVAARCLTKSHVSAAVEHLTQLGLLTQHRDEHNRRKIHLTPTEMAGPVLVLGREASEHIGSMLMNGLTNQEMTDFYNTLNRIAANAEKALENEEN